MVVRMDKNDNIEKPLRIGSILKGVGSLIDSIFDMADNKRDEKNITGELFDPDDSRGLHGEYNFSVKFGLNKENIEKLMGKPENIEPTTEILKNDGQIIIILDMPDVVLEKVNYTIDDTILQIEGVGDDVIYHKEIVLDGNISESNISVVEKDGVFKFMLDYGNQ